MHKYAETGTGQFWAGSIGTFEGAFFVETPRMYRGVDGADLTALATTAVTVAAASAAVTFGVASTSVIATSAETGDKIAGTGVATGAKIVSLSTTGTTTTITVDTAHTAAVTATTVITVTPVTANYRTILAGKQALAEAVAQEPNVVIGPVVDRLMRFRPIGWYGVLGFSRYREAALYRIESGSSISA